MGSQVQYKELYLRQVEMSGEKEESLVKVQKLRRALKRLRREQRYVQQEPQKRGSWFKSILSRLGLNRPQDND